MTRDPRDPTGSPWSEDELRWLRVLARRIAASTADADDLVQEAWLASRRARAEPRSLRAWLAGVLRHRHRMQRRADTRRRRYEHAGTPAPEAVDLETEIQRARVLANVREALDELDESDRSLLLARYCDGYSASELATRLGIPASTVRSRLSRATARMRRSLDERWKDREAWSAVVLTLPRTVQGPGGPGFGALARIGRTTLMGVGMNKSIAAVAALISVVLLVVAGIWTGTRSQANPPDAAPHTGPSSASAGAVPSRPHEDGNAAHGGATLDPRFAASPYRIHGVVTDALGGGLGEATITITLKQLDSSTEAVSLSGVTNDDGAYALPIVHGTFEVSASHPQYAPSTATVELGEGSYRQDFVLTPGAQLSGRVIDAASGRPIAAARVEAVSGSTRSVWRKSELLHVQSDDEGRFHFGMLAPGSLRLAAVTDDRTTYGETQVELAIAESRDDIVLVLEAAPLVRGRVEWADEHRPIVGAALSIRGPSGRRTAASGGDGSFVLPPVAPGEYVVDATASGALPTTMSVRVSAVAAPELVVSLTRGYAIAGTVDPPTEAEVDAEFSTGNLLGFHLGRNASARSDARGRFTLTSVARGRCSLRAVADDGRTGVLDLTVGDRDIEDVVISLQDTLSAQGRVLDADGNAVVHAVVELDGDATSYPAGYSDVTGVYAGRRAITSHDGSFTVARLQTGEHRIDVFDVHGNPMTIRSPDPATLVVSSEHVNEVVVEVTPHQGALRGRIVASEDVPIDVWVSAKIEKRERFVTVSPGVKLGMPIGTDPRPVLADPSGIFAFTGLPEGTYDLEARSADGHWHGTAHAIETGSFTEIELATTAELVGFVTAAGKPVSRFELALEGPLPQTRSTIADTEGRFTLPHLPPGAYVLTVRGDAGTATSRFELSAGEPLRRDITLVPFGRVTASLRDPDGRPAASRFVSLRSPAGQTATLGAWSQGVASSNADGALDLTLEAGTWKMVLDGAPDPDAMPSFSVAPGEHVDLGTIVVPTHARPEL